MWRASKRQCLVNEKSVTWPLKLKICCMQASSIEAWLAGRRSLGIRRVNIMPALCWRPREMPRGEIMTRRAASRYICCDGLCMSSFPKYARAMAIISATS